MTRRQYSLGRFQKIPTDGVNPRKGVKGVNIPVTLITIGSYGLTPPCQSFETGCQGVSHFQLLFRSCSFCFCSFSIYEGSMLSGSSSILVASLGFAGVTGSVIDRPRHARPIAFNPIPTHVRLVPLLPLVIPSRDRISRIKLFWSLWYFLLLRSHQAIYAS